MFVSSYVFLMGSIYSLTLQGALLDGNRNRTEDPKPVGPVGCVTDTQGDLSGWFDVCAEVVQALVPGHDLFLFGHFDGVGQLHFEDVEAEVLSFRPLMSISLRR